MKRKQLWASKMNADPKEKFPVSGLDIEHAKDCADHFGQCSVEEMEIMRNTLHTERVQNFLAGNVGIRNPAGPEEELGRRLVEEDLSLQLSLLKKEMPPSTLFSDPEEITMKVSPGGSVTVEESPVPATPSFDSVVGNGATEAIMICAAIGLVAFAPHLLV